MPSINGNIYLKKLHSMRENPQKQEKTTRCKFNSNCLPSYLVTSKKPLFHLFSMSMEKGKNLCHVKMSLTRGQYAWFSTGRFLKQKKIENHQRLNVEKHSLNRTRDLFLSSKNKDFIAHWLVGLTDGDGCFFVDRVVKPNKHIVWNLGFKISLDQYNTRSIMKAKAFLGVGHVKPTADGMITLRIRDRNHLKKFVFPLFEKIPLLTSKYYDFKKIRDISQLLDNSQLDIEERTKQIEKIYSQQISHTRVAPCWSTMLSQKQLSDLEHEKDSCTKLDIELDREKVKQVISIGWLSGFIEADGSFYIVKKDNRRYCHGFGLTQKGNFIIMQAIRVFLKITASVKPRKSFYSLDSTNWQNIQFIKQVFACNLLGIKSLDFRIWERSFKYHGNYEKLKQIQILLRKIRKYSSSKKKQKKRMFKV